MEESLTILEAIKRDFDCKDVDIRTYSPLTLAYIGDAIYDLVIRTIVVERGNRSANHLHKKTVTYVNARVQAKMMDVLEEELTEEERETCADLLDRLYRRTKTESRSGFPSMSSRLEGLL